MKKIEVESHIWEDRAWLSTKLFNKSKINNKFSIISYHVFADCKSSLNHYSTTKSWEVRSRTLLQEIKCYNPSIICLQDVDHFQDFWRPQLMLLGYDSIYKQRTQLNDFHSEGVAIAYKNDIFQLFKTHIVEFNNAFTDNILDRSNVDSILISRSKTDDVGIMLLLQPFIDGFLDTALCVVCAMLSDSPSNKDIRLYQTQYLSKIIELNNKEFQAPVVIGISLNDSPASMAYSFLRTGRIPLLEQVPLKCKPPYGIATCRGSILLKWLPPPEAVGEEPVIKYKIYWRPGGSKILSFKSSKEVSIGDCIKYSEQLDKNNNKVILAEKELQFIISELCSDIPYEFCIAAINNSGEGPLSDPSEPIVLHNPSKAPDLPDLVNLSNYKTLIESIEFSRMKSNDWDVNKAFDANDALNSLTQLTPRDINGNKIYHISRGRVLPPDSNPREGWKDSLGGTMSSSLKSDLSREIVLSRSLLRNREGFNDLELSQFNDNVDGEVKETIDIFPENDDINSIVLDGREAMSHIGIPNKRQIHDLFLKSAYENYSAAGEPIYTVSMPSTKHNKEGIECFDYIFYSSVTLTIERVLSIPLLSHLKGETPIETQTEIDPLTTTPFYCSNQLFDYQVEVLLRELGGKSFRNNDDYRNSTSQLNSLTTPSRTSINEMKRYMKIKLAKSYNNNESDAQFFGGKWNILPRQNCERFNYFLPNDNYCSTHLAIGVEISTNSEFLSTHWK